MGKKRKRVRTYGDAVVWLAYIKRFTGDTEFAKQAGDVGSVLVKTRDERDEARARCERLAMALEKAEAKQDGESKQ